jgi:hypothetical protein
MRYVKTIQGRYQKVTNEQLKAMRFIPKNATPIEEPGLGVVYVYPCAGKFGVIGYQGDAGKPSFHYSYKRESDMDAMIAKFFQGIRDHKARVTQYREDRKKPHTFKVGDIVTNSWGYDQTNVDWYRVTKTTAHFVWLKPVCATLEPAPGYSPMAGEEYLSLDENLKPIDAENGKETKHAATGDSCTMRHGSGSKYIGGAKYSSWYA